MKKLAFLITLILFTTSVKGQMSALFSFDVGNSTISPVMGLSVGLGGAHNGLYFSYKGFPGSEGESPRGTNYSGIISSSEFQMDSPNVRHTNPRSWAFGWYGYYRQRHILKVGFNFTNLNIYEQRFDKSHILSTSGHYYIWGPKHSLGAAIEIGYAIKISKSFAFGINADTNKTYSGSLTFIFD